MSHNAPFSYAPRLTQNFGREATTILTQGVLLVVSNWEKLPIILILGGLIIYGLTAVIAKCQNCGDFLLRSNLGGTNLNMWSLWIPSHCKKCGHKN
jgi:hypothetical protein